VDWSKRNGYNIKGYNQRGEGITMGSRNSYKLFTILLIIMTIGYSIVALYQLGSRVAPETFWRPLQAEETITIDFGEIKKFHSIRYFGGIGDGQYLFELSTDNHSWQEKLNLNFHGIFDIYVWKDAVLDGEGRFVRITVLQPGGRMYEIGFLGPDGKEIIPIQNIIQSTTPAHLEGNAQRIADETNTIPELPSFLNGMYFDEIYFARTAYEHLHRMEPYDSVQPFFAKILLSLGIATFGMNPFGWRIVGTLFGIAMIPLIYYFGLQLFKKPFYAFIGAFLLTFDFMHFSHSRIATIEVYMVFFILCSYYCMLLFYQRSFYEYPLKKLLIPLFLSGLFYGCASASKLNGIYSGGGLAFIFLTTLLRNYRVHLKIKREYQDFNNQDSTSNSSNSVMVFPHYTKRIILWCLLFFIVIPLTVYALSFIPLLLVPNRGHSFHDLVQYQINMYNYHRNLKATHGYSSPWWQWPLLIRPIWMYQGQGLPEGKIASISSMGNPAIWWPGTLSLIACFVVWLKKRDNTLFFILAGFFSQYLPWAIIPRLTFIYHFFASVPFVIFSIVYLIREFLEKYHGSKYFVFIYLIIVVILFVMFYPVISGMIIDRAYAARFLRWIPSWIFYI
jgi:dolichyl-phosphate-mannose-protein mannosyltransferase